MTQTASQPQQDPGSARTAAAAPPGGRVQLALNVRDVDAAVGFYTSCSVLPRPSDGPGTPTS